MESTDTADRSDTELPPEGDSDIHATDEYLAGQPAEKEAFGILLDALYEMYHVNFNHYRRQTVLRRLARRLSLTGTPNYAAYLEHFKKNPEEQKLLYDDLLLSYTVFFRDPKVFEELKKTVFPRIIRGISGQHPVRIWVPGCSTGQEVYSLAIVLHEFFEESGRTFEVQLFGTDLVERHIRKAREAIYSKAIAEQVSPERLNRFFEKHKEEYKVSKPIREMCIFAVQDVLHDPPFTKIDLISCRNLLIYFDEMFHEKVIPLFHFGLTPDGLLLLGSSESMGGFPELFSIAKKEINLYSRKEIFGTRSYRFPISSVLHHTLSRTDVELQLNTRKSRSRQLSRQIDALRLSTYAPPGVVVDSLLQIRQFCGNTSRYLVPASGEVSFKLLKMTREGLIPGLSVAVEEAKRSTTPVRKNGITFKYNLDMQIVDIEVVPFVNDQTSEKLFLITFLQPGNSSELSLDTKTSARGQTASNGEVEVLRNELCQVKEFLTRTIEEKDEVNHDLWAANEEVLSANEELQSLNEEMEAVKQTLESGNEELLSLNEELIMKNRQLKEAEEQSLTGLTLLKNSQNAAKIGTWWVSLPDAVTHWTDEVFSMFGFDESEEVPSADTFLSRVHPDDRELVRGMLARQSLLEEGPYHYKYRFKPDDSTEKTIEHIARLERDEKGVPVRLLGTVQDISAFEKILEALEESERQLRQTVDELEGVVNAFPGMVLVVDRQFNIALANRAVPLKSGHSDLSGLLGKKCYEVCHNTLDVCSRCGVAEVFDSGKPHSGISTDEEEKLTGTATKTYAIPLKNDTGDTWAAVKIIMDISDLRQKERLIRENERRFRTIIEQAGDAVYISDPDGNIVDVNQRAVESTGYSREELLGKTIMDLDGNLSTREQYQAAWSTLQESAGKQFESSHRHRNGTTFPVEINATRIEMDGRSYIIGVARDITERIEVMNKRQQLERQLYKTQKLESLGVLAGGIAHDFNNLLGGIFGYIELALFQCTSEKVVTNLEKCMKTIERARLLTHQLLTFSKGGSPVKTVRPVFPFIREKTEFVLSGANISAEFVVPEDLWFCNFDENQIGLVIENIVINAKQAMPEGGILSVTAENYSANTGEKALQAGPYVKISVRDNGIGISEQVQPKIFDPFFSTKKLGSGLGLSTAYSIVNKHGGHIDVSSTPGSGTTFFIYLPAVIAQEKIITKIPDTKYTGGGTLIIMDDEEIIRDSCRMLCDSMGYHALSFSDGSDVIHFFGDASQTSEVRAVLVDMTVPGGMGGMRTLEELRKINTRVPVFIVSGYADDPVMADPQAYGFTASICKPFTRSELAALLRTHLGEDVETST